MNFWEKCFSCYILFDWPISMWLSSWDIGEYICIAIVYFSGCDAINFEINLIFLIKLFFYMTKNSTQKFKRLVRWNKKYSLESFKLSQTWDSAFNQRNNQENLSKNSNSQCGVQRGGVYSKARFFSGLYFMNPVFIRIRQSNFTFTIRLDSDIHSKHGFAYLNRYIFSEDPNLFTS